MDAEGFTFGSLVFFRAPWTRSSPERLFEQEAYGVRVRVTALPDGSLIADVWETDTPHRSLRTQRMQVRNSCHAILNVFCDPQIIEVSVAGRDLAPYDSRRIHAVYTIGPITPAPSAFASAPPSLSHPDARKACSDWIKWRKARYGAAKKQAKAGRRLKSFPEQRDELAFALDRLWQARERAAQGSPSELGLLSGELRALLYWNGKNYNPLLLRVAGRLELPLAVYAPEPIADFLARLRAAGPARPQSFFFPAIPRIQREATGDLLMDVQQWLSNKYYEYRAQLDNDATLELVSPKDIMLDAASTMGVSHYDDDIPTRLDLLRRSIGTTSDGLTTAILGWASVITEVGEFTLSEAHSDRGDAIR